MPLKLTDRVRVADSILTSKIESETVVLVLETGRFYSLDSVAARFFELVRSTEALAEIHRQLFE